MGKSLNSDALKKIRLVFGQEFEFELVAKS